MGIKEDTGGGCSVCGNTPAENIEGTYWLCEECFMIQEEAEYVTISREMAIDAGFPEMEGMRWRIK